jgi:hypothetical protein
MPTFRSVMLALLLVLAETAVVALPIITSWRRRRRYLRPRLA